MKKKYYSLITILLIFSLLFVLSIRNKEEKQNKKINTNFKVQYLQEQIETIYSLLDEKNLDMQTIKSKYETMYSEISSIMLELYENGITQDKVLGFNDTLDQTLHEININDIPKTFEYLTDLYAYLPNFVVDDNLYKNILEVKLNIYECRSSLEKEDWDLANSFNKLAVQEYMDILNSVDKRLNQEQINITYITINEMENAVNLRDKAIYLIKYKFLLEELKSI